MLKPTRRLLPFVFAGMCWPAGLSDAQDAVPEPTAEEQAYVDREFRDKITAVRRSRDTADDETLIAEMLAAAAEVPDSPGVQRLLYETALELGMSTGAYAAAIESAEALRSAFPGAESASDEALLEMLQDAYRNARRDDRAMLATPYLDTLLAVASASESLEDTARAGALYREGITVARSNRSPLLETLETRLRRLNDIEQVNSRIRLLRSALEVNPRNANAARDLTMLLILERHDPTAAAEYVGLSRDDELAEVVHICAQGVAAAGAPEAVRAGGWYLGLADEEPDHAEYLLGEALAYYDRFLSEYTRDDALRDHVADLRGDVTGRLDDIADEQETQARGEWGDVIAEVDPVRHAIGEAMAVRGGQVYVNTDNGFVVPFVPESGYDLRIRMRFDRGPDGVVFYLPLGGENGAVLQYSRWDHSRIQLDKVERVEDERFMLAPGREVELTIAVRMQPEQKVGIALLVDGEACLSWSGPIDELEVSDNVPPSERHGNAVAVRCGGRCVFRSIEVRQPE